jgi:hypothetical protein
MITRPDGSELATSQGQSIEIVALLGSGGQGEVFKLSEPAGHVLKLYFDNELASDATLEDRLTVMVRSALSSSVKSRQALAWPTDLVWSGRRFAGYLMPLIDRSRAIAIHRIANPSDARQSAQGATSWARDISWAFLIATAAHLAMAVHELHDAGVVIGDFNENNVLVWQDARISLLDCDSMQISDDDGRHFLCRVGRKDFMPPELQRANWANTVRAPSSDLFALAIHIHQLVMEGEHPFRGVWSGPGEKPTGEQLAAEGLWTHSDDPRLRPRPSGVSVEILSPQLQMLFERAFVDGAVNPRERPSAKEWCEALLALYHSLRPCDRTSSHLYRNDLEACPWCQHEQERSEQRRLAAAVASVSTTPAKPAVAQALPATSATSPARSRRRHLWPPGITAAKPGGRPHARLVVACIVLLVGVSGIGAAAALSGQSSAGPGGGSAPPVSLPSTNPSQTAPVATTVPAPPLFPDAAPTTTTPCPTTPPNASVSLSNEAEATGHGGFWTMDISATVTNTTSASIDVYGGNLTMVDGNGHQLQSQYLESSDSAALSPGQSTTLYDSGATEESSSPPDLGALTLSWDWAPDSSLALCPGHITG